MSYNSCVSIADVRNLRLVCVLLFVHKHPCCRFAAAGQSHVFYWYDAGKLSAEEADSLYDQLRVLDLPRINTLFTETMKAKVGRGCRSCLPVQHAQPPVGCCVPIPCLFVLCLVDGEDQAVGINSSEVTPVTNTEKLGGVDQAQYQEWAGKGLQAIAKGQVCSDGHPSPLSLMITIPCFGSQHAPSVASFYYCG